MEKKNAVRCLLCGDEIESKHTHDFQTCSCGNVSVDGGTDYRRRVFDTVAWIEIEDSSGLQEV